MGVIDTLIKSIKNVLNSIKVMLKHCNDSEIFKNNLHKCINTFIGWKITYIYHYFLVICKTIIRIRNFIENIAVKNIIFNLNDVILLILTTSTLIFGIFLLYGSPKAKDNYFIRFVLLFIIFHYNISGINLVILFYKGLNLDEYWDSSLRIFLFPNHVYLNPIIASICFAIFFAYFYSTIKHIPTFITLLILCEYYNEYPNNNLIMLLSIFIFFITLYYLIYIYASNIILTLIYFYIGSIICLCNVMAILYNNPRLKGVFAQFLNKFFVPDTSLFIDTHLYVFALLFVTSIIIQYNYKMK